MNTVKLRIFQNQMEDVEGLHNAYPYTHHHVDLTQTQVPWHWHEALEINYVVSGRVKVSTTGGSWEFGRNEAFFINRNVLTAMEHLGACVLDSHLFHPIFLSGHFKSVFETKYMDPVVQNRQIELVQIRGTDAGQRQLLRNLQELTWLQQQTDTEFQTRNCLSRIWLQLLEIIRSQQIQPTAATARNQDRILTMLAYIQENFAEKLTLEQIADAASISVRECLRCFRTSIQQTPMDYLLDYRLQMARKLLETTRLPVTEIASRCGFGSGAYFGKQFRETCGKTPSQYRKELEALSSSRK